VGGDLEANNGTTAYAVQRRGKHASTTMELLLGKHVPAASLTHATEATGCCLRDLRRGFIKIRELVQQVSWALMGNWEEMTLQLSLDRDLAESSAREAVKSEPERVKLKNLYCPKPLQGNGRWRHKAGKRLSRCCGNL
jgi:hypothetical protein